VTWDRCGRKSIWGLRYKDIAFHDAPVRDADKRGYDELSVTPTLRPE
jgi:hypothetical protein